MLLEEDIFMFYVRDLVLIEDVKKFCFLVDENCRFVKENYRFVEEN